MRDDGQRRGRRFWDDIRLGFKKENISLKERYPRGIRISAFPKLRGFGGPNHS